MTDLPKTLNDMPAGLSAKGKKAYKTIRKFLEAHNLTATYGCTTFYNPKEWKEMGHEYGLNSHLVVVYEGSSVKRAFSMDACYNEYGSKGNCYEVYERMQEELTKIGMFFEECTLWHAAIYDS